MMSLSASCRMSQVRLLAIVAAAFLTSCGGPTESGGSFEGEVWAVLLECPDWHDEARIPGQGASHGHPAQLVQRV